MASDPFMDDLPAARGLAQQLWGQCRESHSSYKLLSASVKNLRNVLEELEEFELGPEDMNLEAQIAQCRELLERLNLSLQSYQSSQTTDVDESAVADFKTSLDVIGQELITAHDAMSMGEIPLQLDTAALSGLPSRSSNWASTSASAVESVQERHESTRTSSAYSMIAQANPWRQDESNAAAPVSDEKEAYHLSTPYLQIPASDRSFTATSPSVDFRFPFASPDLMSISIEQASSMILRDDDAPGLSSPGSRSTNISSSARSHTLARQSEPDLATGLGILDDQEEAHHHPVQPQDRALSAIRPRAASESAHFPHLKPSEGSVGTDLAKLHPTKSNDLLDRAPSRRPISVGGDAVHLSPNTVTPEAVRRRRTTSGPSTSFSTRSVETGEPTASHHDGESSGHESYRKDLSIVFEAVLSETDEPTSSISQSRPATSDSSSQQPTRPADIIPLPPPPTRRPPSPPKQRRVPRIPRRSSTYRIVNAAVSDQSSSDDDHEDELYSGSKHSSPTSTKHSLESQANERQSSGAHAADTETGLGTEARHERRSGKERITHAQRVLMARAAYTPQNMPVMPPPNRSQTSAKVPAVTTKLSTQSLLARRHSEENSPPLKRHSTSVMFPNNRLVKPEMNGNRESNAPESFDRTATRPYSSSVSQSEIVAPVVAQDSSASTQEEDAASVFEKELVPETGLEVGEPSGTQHQNSQQINADASMSTSTTFQSNEAPEDLVDTENRSLSNPNSISRSEYDDSLTEWYPPGNQGDPDDAEVTDLDAERINIIVHFWNSCAWDEAESYLNGYLESLIEEDRLDRARRVRHLLGICASFRGQWEKAISLFLSVLRVPISDISQIDDGDCAAAYWLGDAYALLNQRDEALLAYCIAEHGSTFLDSEDTGLSDCINAEQDAVKLGASNADFQLRLSQLSFSGHPFGPQSILEPQVVTAAAVTSLFEYQPRKSWKRATSSAYEPNFELNSHISRSSSFLFLNRRFQPSQRTRYHRLKIVPAEFEPDMSWPMMYDPFFSMANVRRGRLLLYECDLLAVFSSNTDAKLPKSIKVDCFTSPDLTWLIKTIRECLRMLEMDWSEVTNIEGTWFIVRYSFIQSRIATTHYFSIGLFKQSLKLRSAYGVEICPDGICSARIVQTDSEHQKGVHISEPKRIRKLIREYLDNAGKQQVKVR